VNHDAALIEATRNGDSHAFGLLVRAYQDRVYHVVRHWMGDHQEAEDLVQETFVQAYLKLASFRGASSFTTWIFRIAFNLTATRRKKRRPTQLDPQSPLYERLSDRGETPEERLQREERAGQVQAALAGLSDEYRAVLVLREMEDCDYESMAEILDLPIGTVRSRLHRARLELRDRLQAMQSGATAERT